MNGPTHPASTRAAAPANSPNRNRASAEAPSDQIQHLAADAKKLVSVMEQNRAKIDENWAELNRLDQVLTRLDSKLGASAKETAHQEPTPLKLSHEGEAYPRAA